jgi:hypothetical protein
MTRPLKPVTQSEEEKRVERRFTRRMLLLALAGGVLGVGVQTITRTMGKPPTPVPVQPGLVPGCFGVAVPEPLPNPPLPPPRLGGK